MIKWEIDLRLNGKLAYDLMGSWLFKGGGARVMIGGSKGLVSKWFSVEVVLTNLIQKLESHRFQDAEFNEHIVLLCNSHHMTPC
jgi:hypothetical protein